MKNYKSNKELSEKTGFTPLFETVAILDDNQKAEITNVTTPPQQSIQDAKDWVEHNEK